MELKRHLNFRNAFVAVYFALFAVYLIIGFQPTDAARYSIVTSFSAPEIGISTQVADLSISDGKLDTPSTIAGRYSTSENKVLIIGHSTTVFQDLFETKIGDVLIYDGNSYTVNKIEIREKSTIKMNEVLDAEEVPTIVVMTCAGELYDNGDASHRYMITATISS